MRKRGLSEVISLVLIVLLVMASIGILWGFFGSSIRNQGEVFEAKNKISTEKFAINGFSMNGNNAQILVSKGPSKLIVVNVSEVEIEPPKVDLFSVIDTSLTMRCTVQYGGGDETNTQTSYYNQTNCEMHNGTWLLPINNAKSANGELADLLLNLDGNRMGAVAFANETTSETNFHPLTDDANSLKAEVNSWETAFRTCMCCGIEKAISEYDGSSSSQKIMIVMSDGAVTPVPTCSSGVGGSAGAMIAAQEAANQGITIHTIAFGTQSGAVLLQNISNVTGGKFYVANYSELLDVYTTIATEIVEQYSSVSSSDFLLIVFYNSEGESYSYMVNDPPGESFASQSYSVTLPDDFGTVTKVEVYVGVITPSGEEVISDYPIDSYVVN